MRERDRAIPAAAILVVILAASRAGAGVIEFENKDEWIAAIGSFVTVDFTGFEPGTFITDQYADLGVLFTDGNDSIHFTPSFLNDGWGLDGNGDIAVVFDTPMAYIGMDFPGDLQIDLYADGRLIHSSVFFGGGVGFFLGLISTQPFDSAILIDPVGLEVAIDDLHFGVPAPSALALLALAALRPRRRRC